MTNMIFHGTVYDFDIPALSKCKDKKDFGKGFYLAENIEHARSIAQKAYLTKSYIKNKFIYSYKIDIAEMRKLGLKVHVFNEPNYAWLDFVIKNRKLLDVEEYDVIIGATADRSAQTDIEAFYKIHGLNATNVEKDRLLKNLQIKNYGRQYCFRTQRAIDYLNTHFVERRTFV